MQQGPSKLGHQKYVMYVHDTHTYIMQTQMHVLVQKRHKKAEADENHDVHVLEDGVVLVQVLARRVAGVAARSDVAVASARSKEDDNGDLSQGCRGEEAKAVAFPLFLVRLRLLERLFVLSFEVHDGRIGVVARHLVAGDHCSKVQQRANTTERARERERARRVRLATSSEEMSERTLANCRNDQHPAWGERTATHQPENKNKQKNRKNRKSAKAQKKRRKEEEEEARQKPKTRQEEGEDEDDTAGGQRAGNQSNTHTKHTHTHTHTCTQSTHTQSTHTQTKHTHTVSVSVSVSFSVAVAVAVAVAVSVSLPLFLPRALARFRSLSDRVYLICLLRCLSLPPCGRVCGVTQCGLVCGPEWRVERCRIKSLSE